MQASRSSRRSRWPTKRSEARASPVEKRFEATHAFCQPILARCEAPANEPASFRPEGAARCQPESAFVHELLAECEAVGDAVEAEERVHRAGRRRRVNAVEF